MASLGFFSEQTRQISVRHDKGVYTGLCGSTEEDRRHRNNTPNLVFCALVCDNLLKNHDCVPNLLTSEQREKQVVCSSEIKFLSSKRAWKESASTRAW